MTSSPPESVRTVPDALEWAVDQWGANTFLRYHEREISFEELHETSTEIANTLHSRGIGAGDHVSLLLYNSPEFVSLFFALAKLGSVVTPIDTRFTGKTLTYVLRESDVDVIFVDSQTHDEYEAIRDDVSDLTTEYFIGSGDHGQGYRTFDELVESNASQHPDIDVTHSDTVSLTYVQRHPTNHPKGVLMPHFSYVNTGWEASINMFDYSDDDLIFTTLPLYSIYTFQMGIMGSLLSGAQFAIGEKFDPEVFWDRVDYYDATIFLYLSRMLSVLYNQHIEPEGGITSAQKAIGSSPGFTPDTDLFKNFEQRFDITVFEGYGSTETASMAVYNSRNHRKLGSVGKPPSYAEVEIVDQNDWPVPTGERGEIVIRPTRPNTLFKGYYKEPKRAADVCRNQWIHTGGIGYRDDDGYVFFVATEENSVYRGRIAGRISSLEIESVIESKFGVATAAVIGVMNDDGHEDILSIVVPEPDVELDPVDICKHCEQQLPYIKVPRYIEIRESLPRTPSGKLNKQTLRETDTTDVWDRESGFELSR